MVEELHDLIITKKALLGTIDPTSVSLSLSCSSIKKLKEDTVLHESPEDENKEDLFLDYSSPEAVAAEMFILNSKAMLNNALLTALELISIKHNGGFYLIVTIPPGAASVSAGEPYLHFFLSNPTLTLLCRFIVNSCM